MTYDEAFELIDKYKDKYQIGVKIKNNRNEIFEIVLVGVTPDRNGVDFYADCILVPHPNEYKLGSTSWPIHLMNKYFEILE